MNRFITKGALNADEHSHIMIHRAELDKIIEHIEHYDDYIALCNPRQTGKTTLLFQLQTSLQDRGYGVAYLDLMALDKKSEPEFYKIICEEMLAGLAELIDDNPDLTPQGMSDLTPQEVADEIDFSDFLMLLSARTPQARKVVLVLDEIGGVPEEIASTFFPALRKFFTKGRRPSKQRDLYRKIIFCFAGALDLIRLTENKKNSPLSNVCTMFDIDDFSAEQVRRLVSNLSNFSLEHLNTIAVEVYGWTDGHPYLTERLCLILDDCEDCRRVNVSRLPDIIDDLVSTHFIDGDDVNLTHVMSPLRENKAYFTSAFEAVKKGNRKMVAHRKDLLTIGIIKRSVDHYLVARNRIYEECLNNFFEVYSDGIGNEK